MEFVVENLSPTRKKIAFTLTADDVNAAINTAVKGFQKDLSLPGFRSETLLHFLAEREIYVSSGSACSKGKKSPVLTAMGLSADQIDSALRISFSWDNTIDDVDRLTRALHLAEQTLIRR